MGEPIHEQHAYAYDIFAICISYLDLPQPIQMYVCKYVVWMSDTKKHANYLYVYREHMLDGGDCIYEDDDYGD